MTSLSAGPVRRFRETSWRESVTALGPQPDAAKLAINVLLSPQRAHVLYDSTFLRQVTHLYHIHTGPKAQVLAAYVE